MAEQYYNLLQVAALLTTNRMTLREWLQDAHMTPVQNPGNKKERVLTRRQVEQLAHAHNRTLAPESPAKPADPLAALEARLRGYVKQEIAALEQRLQENVLKASPAPQQSAPIQSSVKPPISPSTATTARSSGIPERPVLAAPKPQRFSTLAGVQRFLFAHLDEPDLLRTWGALPMTSGTALLRLAQQHGAALHPCTDHGCICHVLLEG